MIGFSSSNDKYFETETLNPILSLSLFGIMTALVMETDEGQLFSGALGCGRTDDIAAAYSAIIAMFDELFKDYPKALLLLTLNELRDMPHTLARVEVMKAIMRIIEGDVLHNKPNPALFKSKNPSDLNAGLDQVLHNGGIVPPNMPNGYTFDAPELSIPRPSTDDLKAKPDINDQLRERCQQLFDERHDLPPFSQV